MSKEKPDGLTPLELLSKLDAATLDAAMAEIKGEMDKLDRKRRELLMLHRAMAFRNGEFKRAGRQRKPVVASEPPASPEPAAPQQPAPPLIERMRKALEKLGAASATQIAVHACAPAASISIVLLANKDVFECMGAGRWRLRASK